MGTETNMTSMAEYFMTSIDVKLNNPLMGTETQY